MRYNSYKRPVHAYSRSHVYNRAPRPATQSQTAYAKVLWEQRDLSMLHEAYKEMVAAVTLDGLTLTQASGLISVLKMLPLKPRPASANTSPVRPPATNVPEGRYAVPNPVDGKLTFYVVDRPTQGRWAGYVFLNQLASDNRIPIKDAGRRTAILALIAHDPMAAMLRYGKEVGRCGHCGRLLTDDASRHRGIGPVCAEKVGAVMSWTSVPVPKPKPEADAVEEASDLFHDAPSWPPQVHYNGRMYKFDVMERDADNDVVKVVYKDEAGRLLHVLND